MALIAVSGHLKDVSGANIAGSVVFQLVNYGAAIPRVIGTNALVPTNVTFTAGANGAWSGNIQSNDSIDPGASNTPPTTYYTVQFRDANGAEIQTVAFNFTGAGPANLDSQAPLVTIPSPSAPPNTAALTATGNTFAGPNTFNGQVKLNDLVNINSTVFVDGSAYPLTDVGITSAIAALPAGGGTVFLSPGTYQLASTMTISKANVTLAGYSPYNTHFFVNHTSDVIVSTAGQLQLLGLSFEVQTASTRSGSYILNIQSASGLMWNCRIAGNNTSPTNGSFAKLFTSSVGSWVFDTVSATVGTWTIGWYCQASSGTVAGINFSNIITDNTLTFTDSAYKFDTGCDTIFLTNCQNGAAGRGIYCLNSLAGQAPRWIHAVNCRIEGGGSATTNVALQVDDGRDIRYLDGYLASAQNAALLNGGTYIDLSHNVIVNIGQHGIIHTAIPTNVSVVGNTFEDIGVTTSNTYDYINVAGGATTFTYADNQFRQLSANHPRFVLNLLTGATASFSYLNNNATQPTMGTGYLNNNASGGNQNFFANTPAANFPNTVAANDISTQTLTNKTLTGASSGNSVTLLNAQANAAAITGTGAAAILYTYTLPANTVATLKGIRIRLGFNHSTGTASVTYSITLNGVAVSTQSSATTGQGIFEVLVLNTASTTGTQTGIFGVASSPNLVTGTLAGLAWTSNQIINANFNVAATDQVTPIFWLVELIQ